MLKIISKQNLVITFILLILLSLPCYSNVLEGRSQVVMLQGFHWYSWQHDWWKVIADKARDIAYSKFDMVWLPPSSGSASKEGYLPHKYYLQDSEYGNEQALKYAISALHSYGVKAIADIVINHRVGVTNWGDFDMPKWGTWSVCSNDEWPESSGNPDTGDGYSAARDIDHTNATVQKDIIGWQKWLKSDIGYDGWRYDYSKGYSGYYVGLYNSSTNPYFSVGEYWDNLNINDYNPHRQRLCNWIDQTKGKSAAFDFTTKGMLQRAVRYSEYWRLKDSEGKPCGLIGWWPSHAVTFLDNHDTGPSANGGQNHWPFPGEEIMQGYAYILTHPGIPCVYWVHFYDWGLKSQISELIKIRKEQGLHSTSKVSIKAADGSKYAAIIDGKVAVKIGRGGWSPGQGWILATYGKNYSVWTK